MENEIKNNQKLFKIDKEVFMTLIPILFLYVMNLFFIGINDGFWLVMILGRTVIFESLISFLIFAVFLGVLKKGKTAITLLGIVILLLSIINQVKYAFMGDPILITDFMYLGNTGEIFQIVEGEIWKTISSFIIPICST